MMCTCAICGFTGEVFDYHLWRTTDRRYPQLWICDICYVDIKLPG